jgi:hypothetical protein
MAKAVVGRMPDQAASEAYDATLAPIHTYLVRMAIKGSIYLLPDRATFIAQIGETGACAHRAPRACCGPATYSAPVRRPWPIKGPRVGLHAEPDDRLHLHTMSLLAHGSRRLQATMRMSAKVEH